MSPFNSLHAEVERFDVIDNCVAIGGEKMTDIAKRIGQTPFYIYDSNLIDRRVRMLRDALPKGISLHYAMKANPMPEVVSLLAAKVDGLDVASGRELSVALQSGCDPRNISFAGPGKSEEELAAAINAGIVINIESTTELDRIKSIAEATQLRPEVAIRVNPDFELKSSGMKMAGGPKQFGIDAEMVPEVLQSLTTMPVDFAGFHIFSGSQNLHPDALCESQQKAYSLAIELAKYAPRPPRLINIGGGFGIPYFPGDSRLDLAPISKNLKELLSRCRKDMPGAELILELGRYFVAEAGLYICEVVDRKISRGETFLITNGGLHHHLAASGNFGQVIRKNYPVLVANNVSPQTTETVSVVGPLCTPLDILANRMTMAVADIGDLIAVFQSGAYGYTASPHLFLSHPPPAEVFV